MRHLVAALASIACAAASSPAQTPLELAEHAARWIDAHAIETDEGLAWPSDPEHTGARSPALYAGQPGVVLFLLELAQATDDEHWMERATAGAADLAAHAPRAEIGAGLYSGLGGVAFTLARAADITGEARFDDDARACIDRMHALATTDGDTASWGPVTDIISGDAGAGLTLLWAHERWRDARDLDLATQAGRHLLAIADEARGGLSWPMSPDFPRRMPNFSHGTAGVGFFLAQLAGATGDDAFRIGAIRAGERLLAISEHGLIHHHAPGGEDLYYLGWCHGPTGTARLYEALFALTGEARWRDAALAGARAVLATGAPAQRTDGFWNNAGICCGTAGIGGFLLDESARTGDAALRDGAAACLADLARCATIDGKSAKWIHAEHRARPEFLVAQTGYMQGAAGIGLALLRFDALERGRPWTLRLPDDLPLH